MADDDFTAEEFAKWIPIRQAVEMADGQMGNTIYREIINRLRNGLIDARAENAIGEVGSRKMPFRPHSKVGLKIWDHVAGFRHLSSSGFWRSNTVEANINEGPHLHSPAVTYTYYGVRLDPAGVAKMLGRDVQSTPVPQTPPPAPAPQPLPEPTIKGPPFAAKALTAWYEAYKLAYTPAERTLDHAWNHAKAAFPEKTVTRQAVRALMPGSKPGPRTKG